MTTYRLAGKRVWVAGHRGMVGSAIVRRLQRESCAEILTVPRDALDLRDQKAVQEWCENNRPEAVFVPAGKVGGIHANDTFPAEFLYDNLMIAANIINSAAASGTEKLLYLGSSCIYPRLADQPMREDQLLSGPLEPTNEWYAIAKIAGIKLCQSYRRQYGKDFIAALPSNLYGSDDNYHPHNSHVIPALLRKAHLAKTSGKDDLEIWGTGIARREFMHVDDCADALVFLMQNYSSDSIVNVGVGEDISIADLARMVMHAAGLEGRIITDPQKPDGAPRKLMDISRLTAMGWAPKMPLHRGIEQTYRQYLTASEQD